MNTRFGFSMMMFAVVTMLAAPTATAAPLAESCTYDPEAWVNYCLEPKLIPVSATAPNGQFTVDYVKMCPTNTVCVYVPKATPHTSTYTVYVPVYDPYVSVNPQAVWDDVCEYLGDYYCVIWAAFDSSSADANHMGFVAETADGYVFLPTAPGA